MTTSSAGSNKSGAKPAVVAEVTSPTDANRRSDKLLKSAWDRHDIYNHNASQAQKRFFFVRQLLACLSVAVVFLSVLQPIVRDRVIIDNVDDLSLMFLVKAASQQITLGNPFPDILWLALIDFSLILLPIFTTGLLAFAVKFDRGNNWILLRGNSETLRMEIFYYRTGVKQYQRNRNAVLAERIKMISERGKGSSIHQSALSPYEGQQSLRIKKGIIILIFEKTVAFIKIILDALWNVLFQYQEVEVSDESTITADAGPAVEEPQPSADYMQRYADLDANSYIRYRLEDQFNWYRRKAKVYDQGYQILQTSVYIFGGMGTLLAAIGFQNWVAVTASLAGALASHLEYKRVEATLIGYNQAADALYDIRTWWYALSEEDQSKFINFEKLVTSTEETIRSEHTSWLQDMQDRLANLYGDATEDDEATLSDAAVTTHPAPANPPDQCASEADLSQEKPTATEPPEAV